MAPAVATYEPRDPSHTVLYHVIADHLETFLAALDADADKRIRKIKGLLALSRPYLSSAPGAGEAAQAGGGERRRGALGDSRLGKSMATQEGARSAVCALPSRRAQGQRDSTRRRRLRRPSHRWLGEYGQAR
jgi:hypothetical protein